MEPLTRSATSLATSPVMPAPFSSPVLRATIRYKPSAHCTPLLFWARAAATSKAEGRVKGRILKGGRLGGCNGCVSFDAARETLTRRDEASRSDAAERRAAVPRGSIYVLVSSRPRVSAPPELGMGRGTFWAGPSGVSRQWRFSLSPATP